jgi:hypothetical protein
MMEDCTIFVRVQSSRSNVPLGFTVGAARAMNGPRRARRVADLMVDFMFALEFTNRVLNSICVDG